MDELLISFAAAGAEILAMFVAGETTTGTPEPRPTIFASRPVAIIVGVTGCVQGQVVYSMSTETANRIVAAMMGGDAEGYDGMAISGMAELGNILSGAAVTSLAATGRICEITPPTVVWGIGIQLATQHPGLAVTLATPCGDLDVHVALASADVCA